MIKIIAAIGKNNELGFRGDLPLWKLKSDMERFKKLTLDQVVVMGRKTYESFPPQYRPLPSRINIVLSRDKDWHMQGAYRIDSISDLSLLPSFWIIGGGQIYREHFNLADELHITHIDATFEADTFFPEIDENIWKKVSEEHIPKDDRNSHSSTYTIYQRK